VPPATRPAAHGIARALRRGLNAVCHEDALHRIRLPEGFFQWLESFRPQVVYALFSTLQSMELVRQVTARCRAALVVHMMDDWPEVVYRRTLATPLMRAVALRKLRRLMKTAAARLAICDAMKEEYEARYNLPFESFHSPVDLDAFAPHARTRWTSAGPIVVRYGGRVGTGISSSLLDVAGAVALLRARGLGIRLDVVTHCSEDPVARALASMDAVSVRPPVPQEELPSALAAADILVIPYDFDEEAVRFVRYSMPTKTAESMASGTPVMVYAHPDTAVARYALVEGWAEVVTTPGSTSVATALERLSNDPERRKSLALKALAVAKARHGADQVRTAFRSVLAGAAGILPQDAP
jgi:glycosyltransferase involved in cell wall biosynthesis